MYAITTLSVKGDEFVVHHGALFPTPVELLTPEQVRRYCRAPQGWSTCPLGFCIFSQVANDGTKIVVPGIIVPGEKSPRRKLPDYKIVFEKKQIEKLVGTIIEEHDRIEAATSQEMRALAHDLRALSAEIYNAAEASRGDFQNKHYQSAAVRTDTVIAAQQMLSLRLDMIDFATGQFSDQPGEAIPVYKKVDKVVRCFRPKANVNRQNLVLQGPSVGFVYGPPIFELIPFVLVQNATKYAPPDSDIVVKVSDFSHQVQVHVQSKGPKIREDEKNKIFERNYRGIEAKNSGLNGSGLGLFAAKSLMSEVFAGIISVRQDDIPVGTDIGPMYQTTFTIGLPRMPNNQ